MTDTDPNLTDATRRLLRSILAQGERRLFAGNHTCRGMLIAGGYIREVERKGQWARLEVTEKGRAVA